MNGQEDIAPYKTFQIRPQLLESGKTVQFMKLGEALTCSVQVVASGGETNLHAHTGSEAIWLVLNGRATFYGEADRVIATLGRNDALYIPAGAPYWFESSSPDNLVILRFGAMLANVENKRIDYSERKFALRGEAGYGDRPTKVMEGAFFGG